MKKRALTIAAAAFVVLAMASCKKCKDCHYDGPSGEVELGEYCGDDIENIESSGHTVDTVTYDVHCSEH